MIRNIQEQNNVNLGSSLSLSLSHTHTHTRARARARARGVVVDYVCMLCSHGATVTCRQSGQFHVRICVICGKKAQLNCCNGGRRKGNKGKRGQERKKEGKKEERKKKKAMIDEDKNLMVPRFIPAGLFQQFNLTNNRESLHDSCSRRVVLHAHH